VHRAGQTDSSNNEQVHGGDIWGVIAQESESSLAGRSSPFDHVPGNARLSYLKPKLEKLAWMRGALFMLSCRINARSPISICGRPPKDRDFQRQQQRKSDWGHWMSISGG
jgi:hypothetical protein